MAKRFYVVTSLAACLAIGCGGGAGISVEPAEEFPSRSVWLEGVPSEIDEPTVRFRALEDEWSDWSVEILANRDDTGRLLVRVPSHPAGLDEGGTLEVSVAGLEDATSTLKVLSVPAAPGTTRQYVASTARMVREMIEDWDVSADEVMRSLRDNPEELSPQLFYAAFAVDLLAGPDNPNALLHVIDGTAPILDGRTLDLDAADRLLALWWVVPATVSHRPRQVLSVHFASMIRKNPPGPTSAMPRSGKVSIHSAGALDHWMRERTELEQKYGGLKRETRNDIANVVDLIPHPAASVLVMANNAFEYSLRSNLALLPSKLDKLKVEADPKDFLEDEVTTGTWKASVVASSGIFQFTYADLVEATAGAWDIAKFGTTATRVARGVATERSLAFDVADYAGQRLADKSKDWKKDKTDVEGPYQWGPFDVSDKNWTQAHIANVGGTEPCVRLTNLQRSYVPNAAGNCLLVVEIRTDGGKFGGVSSDGNAPLLVKTIRVEVAPNGITVEPESRTTFSATVRNADRKDVTWTATGGSGTPGRRNTYTWTAPQLEGERCRDLFTIEAESSTRRGARASGEPPRIGRATITVQAPGQLEIVPDEVVLTPGEEFTFGYRAQGSPRVRWSADSPGQIDRSSGSYTAPMEEGSYTVRASRAADGGRSCDEDEAVVRVSTCSWMVMYDGIMYRGQAGDHANFIGSPEGYTIGLEREDGSHVFLTSNQMEGNAVTGNMGLSGNRNWGSYFAYKDPKIPISVFLDRNRDGVVAGRASGTVKVMDPSSGIVGRAQFSAEFVIADVANATDADAGPGGGIPGLEQLGNFLSADQRAEIEAQMREYEGMMAGLPMLPLTCEITE